MKKVTMFLKTAIIIALGIIIFSIIGKQSSSSAVSYWGTREDLVTYVTNNPSKILNGNSASLLGKYLSCNDNGKYIKVHSACFAHWRSNGSGSYYRIDQVISWQLDDNGNYYAYNYLVDTTDSNSPYNLSTSSKLSTSLIKLAGAIEYQVNVSKTNTGYSYGNTNIGYYFHSAINNGLATVSAIKNSTEWSTSTTSASETAVSSYYSTVKNFKKITVDDSSATATTSGSSIIIGPITVTFSGSIESISVDGYSGTVKWATSKTADSDDWSSKVSGIKNNKKIYIKLNKNKLTTSDTYYKITFTQETGIYNCELLVTASTSSGAQTFGTFTAATSPYTCEATAEVLAIFLANIELEKEDAKTGDDLEGIGFTIYDKTVKQYINADGEYTSKAKTIYTNSKGKISITDIPMSYGTHEIVATEVASKNEYYTTVSSNTDTQSISSEGTLYYKFTNEPLELVISKTSANTGDTLQGVGFKLKYSDGTWVKGNGSGEVTYVSSSSSADEYITGSDGTVTIVGLKKGTYTVYETSIDTTYSDGFYLEDQEGYDSTNDWVKCGTVKVNEDEKTSYSVAYSNTRRVKIAGYVWVENDENKNSEYDDFCNDGSKTYDKLPEGVKVYLYKKNSTEKTSDDTMVTYTDASGNKVSYVTTDSNGQYEFDYNWGILYSELSDYYVKFDYTEFTIDGETYSGEDFITVAFNSEDADSIQTNGSRALMDEVAEEDEDLEGIATTYTGTKKESTYGLSGNLLDKLYNESNNTLEYINLGIKPIYEPDYEISESLLYVKIVINDYVYLYEYNGTSLDLSDSGAPTVKYQHPTRTDVYQLAVYPSAIYQMANGNGGTIEVYVVYAIKINDTEQENVEDLYMEDHLTVTSLSNAYDPTRYELCTEVENASDYELESTVSGDFDDWEDDSTGTATVTTTDGEEETVTTATAKYTGGEFDVEKEGSVTKYIQFKVQTDAITEILDNPNGIAEDYPTTATSKAYHVYNRKDYSWDNAITDTQSHKTAKASRSDSAPYLVFTLGDERQLTGTVFEDTVSTDYSTEDGEVLGNGQKDDEEYAVSGVLVELLIEDEDGSLTQATTYATSEGEEATTTTDDDGNFTFTGVTPGEYYLRFTYPNGETKIMNSDGTLVTIDEYKSTIVTSTTAMNALGYSENTYEGEWYKYLEDSNYSVAVDDLDTREKYNSGEDIDNMTAQTALISVTIENTQEDYTTEGDKHVETFDGFNLGIIEQPDQEVSLEKVITNVKLVNTPTTIFDGNPQTDSMSGVTDLDGDSTNEGSTYTRVEIDEDSIYGSELTITYEIRIENISDLNYYETDDTHYGYYYMFGITGDYSKQVMISADEIDDYLDSALELISATSTNEGDEITIEEIEATDTDEAYFKITGLEAIARTESATITINANKVLSTSDEDMGFENIAKITELSNVPQEEDEENDNALKSIKLIKTPILPDEAEAYLTVTPPTGSDIIVTVAMYIGVTAVMLAILSVGIVIIKKKVL